MGQRRKNHESRRLLALICAATVLEVIQFGILTPLLPGYSEHYRLSKAGSGMLVAAYGVGLTLAALPAGLVIDKRGSKFGVIFGIGVFTTASVLFALGPGIAALDSARGLQAVGAAFVWEGGLVWLVTSQPDRRGELIGIVLGTAVIGSLLGPAAGTLATITGPAACVSVIAGISVALALAISKVPDSGHPTAGIRIRSLIRKRDGRLRAGIWYTVLPALAFGTVTALAPLQFAGLGAGSLVIGATFVLAAAAEAGTSPVAARLCDRHGPRPLLRVAMSVGLCVLIAIAVTSTALGLAGAVIVAGVSFGLAWVPANALLARSAAQDSLGESVVFALWLLAWSTGQMLGALGGSQLADATTMATPYLGLAVCYLATLVISPAGG